jgi:hypothetical protein
MDKLLNARGKSFDTFLKNMLEDAYRHRMVDEDRGFATGRASAFNECAKFFDRKFKLVLVQEEVKDKNE